MSGALAALEAAARVCTACRLSETRTTVVFGTGSADADLMFVGEAPGRNEDLEGKPFVGAAGRLLNTLLAEVGIERERVYIANVLKCRPPNNRDPLPDEIEACKGHLRGQLALIDPAVVVTLGNFATKLLLRTEVGITRLRGSAYPWWRGKHLVPTLHPAAALRSGDRIVELMRQDFGLIRRTLDGARTGLQAVAAVPSEPEQLGLFA